MKGLILAGIGKGIADAGQTVSNFMVKDIEDKRKEMLDALREERQAARELARDERLSEREAERETRKIASVEAAALKDADIYAKAEAAAPGVGEARRFEKFKKDVGQTDMSEEDLRTVFKDQYDQTKVGTFEGADRYVERYSKQKEDVLSEIRRGGGSSGLINQAVAEVKATRESERAADTLAFNERRLAEQEQRRRDEFKALLPIRQEQAAAGTTRAGAAVTSAGAAVTRANRPPSSGGGGSGGDKPATTADMQRQINAANDDIAVLLGATKQELNQKLARTQKRAGEGDAEAIAKMKEIQPYLDAKTTLNKRMREFKSPSEDGSTGSPSKPKTGDNSGAKKVGKSPHPEGTRLKGPDGTYVVRNGQPVLEK
jgi:hypothetical protein